GAGRKGEWAIADEQHNNVTQVDAPGLGWDSATTKVMQVYRPANCCLSRSTGKVMGGNSTDETYWKFPATESWTEVYVAYQEKFDDQVPGLWLNNELKEFWFQLRTGSYIFTRTFANQNNAPYIDLNSNVTVCGVVRERPQPNLNANATNCPNVNGIASPFPHRFEYHYRRGTAGQPDGFVRFWMD